MAAVEPDPTIWSRLPYVLLPIVVENTADLPTLEAWCQSTKKSSHLHCVAKRETYRTYTIDANSFRPTAQCKPIDRVKAGNEINDDDDNHNDNDNGAVAPNSKEMDKSAHVLCAKFHQEIARHVQRLVLDLECLDLQTPGFARPLADDRDFVWQSFLSCATRLEEIEQNGIVRQVMLDRLLATPLLKVLKIREIWSKHITRCNVLLLTWHKLGQCSSLRVLHVAQLFYAEAAGLAMAIRGLQNLEELRVKASELPLPGANRLKSDDPSPLKPFLQSMYQKTGPGFDNMPVGFPVSLKKLALVDFNSRLMPASLQGLGVASLRHLTHLHLDLIYDSAVIYLIDILNPVKLTHLIISSILHLKSQSAWLQVLDIFARYSSSLRTITLFNAWLNFLPYTPDAEPPWQSFMEFSQLYLNKHPKSSFFTHDNNLHWCIFGNITRPCKWGLGVRQVRIDQVDLDGLKINRIDEPFDGLEQLRILILRTVPEPAKLHPANGHGSLPYPDEPFGPSLPDDMDALKETEIAKAIAAQNLPSLRIISVGGYHFWVQQQTPKTDSHGASGCRPLNSVWFLRRALEDLVQEAEILRVVHPDDWKFLADRSDCLAETASDESNRLANRLVYRKTPTQEVG
ncbi:hypothetical protein MMC07_008908 [Pseudocyphellaria aurata]|nr:hypothetical protein [Pseudocyphellaria aurata]